MGETATPDDCTQLANEEKKRHLDSTRFRSYEATGDLASVSPDSKVIEKNLTGKARV